MRFKWILILSVIILGVAAGGFLALATGVPSVEDLKKYRPSDGAKIYADDNSLIGEFKIEKGIHQPLKEIPKHMREAIIAVEDRRFYSHSGIDYISIARALYKDIIHASLKEGASTITQQLAKVMFLTPEKTITRKLKEMQLAVKLEKQLSKNEILELYLNNVYFGHGAYGIEMASRIYFGKSVSQITVAEAALLAGLVKAPTTYSPYNDLVRSKARQEIVLQLMEEEGYLKPAQRAEARRHQIMLSSLKTATEANNYFLEHVRQQLESKYGVETVYKGGLRVYTTLNRQYQFQAQKALQEGLRQVDKRRGWRGPIGKRENVKTDIQEPKVSFSASVGDVSKGVVIALSAKEATIRSRGLTGKLSTADALWAHTVVEKNGKTRVIKNLKLTDILTVGDIVWVRFKAIAAKQVAFSLDQEPDVEGAVVSISPENGHIKALVGGFSFSRGEFNRAILAKRQPGSAFKPVVFGAALEQGFTPASIVNDEPLSYGSWNPANYDHKHYGPTRLREALAFSRNVVTVKLLESIGVAKVIAFAKDIGIQQEIPAELSIALGSVAITPLEMTAAYATFANAGVAIRPRSILEVRDAKGNVLESNEPEGIVAMSEQDAFLLTSMLQDVILYGTGGRAAIGRPAAGKTGTTNDYKDAWFIGYTPDLATTVWVGFDDMRRPLGRGEVGGRAAAPIWSDYMKNISGSGGGFAIPEGVVRVAIDPATGLLSYSDKALQEFFKSGTQPREVAPIGSVSSSSSLIDKITRGADQD
ncbi:MAG TPA: PBP1A family penicillin-binding protein [Dissulfurispiraceae bacterium]|nr:PBP1A family penicillin-binding protein [Dissulfurispiraceae bacterium]